MNGPAPGRPQPHYQAGYPNSRRPGDDVADNLLPIITRGRMPAGDLVGPHADYLANFPYSGSPH